MRYKVHLAYDGSSFAGWQVQPEKRTVQGEMVRIFQGLGEEVLPTGAGRTDAGVHALGMVAHVDLERPWNDAELMGALVSLAPPEISILEVTPVEDTFHARYDAVARTYHYALGTRLDPFFRLRRWNPGNLPDAARATAELQSVLGVHDFASLTKSGSDADSSEARVIAAGWRVYPEGAVLSITANRFLYGMVRALVGTLVRECGADAPAGYLLGILERRDRTAAGEAAPAAGLYLAGVSYTDTPEIFNCMDAVAGLSGIHSFASPGETTREREATRNHV